MNALGLVRQLFFKWIDAVAGGVHKWLDWFICPPVITLVEREPGEFVIRKDGDQANQAQELQRTIRILDGSLEGSDSATALHGSRVELVLQPERFLFRPLELPTKANEFLEGIVRSQIDRLTPWEASDVAFGWSAPTDKGAGRIAITVASTASAWIEPYVKAIAATGARSLAVFTSPPGTVPGSVLIKVWEERAHEALHVGLIRRGAIIILAIVCVTAGSAIGASVVIGANLHAQQVELAQQIAIARTRAGAAQVVDSGSVAATQRTLEKRKHELPPTVVILEALSQILPDHTYVTELHVEGDKVRLIGITRDAPSLIGLIERSDLFSQATFFAPTTQSDSNQGSNFHIETVVRRSGALPS